MFLTGKSSCSYKYSLTLFECVYALNVVEGFDMHHYKPGRPS